MKTFLLVLLTALAAAVATWFAAPAFKSASSAATTPSAGQRQPLFYQSAMHPWIKSDKPGRCTICGMELTPVYEGQQALDAGGDADIVALTQNQIQVLHVQTSTAAKRPLTRTLQVAGSIEANTSRRRVLSAYLDGRIERLHVNYIGAEVTAGQPLADFYSPTLLQAEREYRQLAGDLRKNTALRLRQMGLTPEQIDALPNKPADALVSQIVSPISGTVVSQSVYEGQYVASGEKLFEIADFSTMWFLFRAYEQDMPWLQTGLTVEVTTPAVPATTFTGEITFIDPNFDPTTRSTNVRVELPNPVANGRRLLLNRLYADGNVQLAAPPVLTVPRSAVIQTGSQAVVYVARGGGAYQRTLVDIGRRGDEFVEILSGLQDGDPVVTNGNLLIDGQAEMNRAFMTPPESPAAPNITPAAALTSSQTAALAQFVALADAMAETLANDDLAAFNTASQPAMDTTAKLLDELRPQLANPDALDAARHFHGFDDLPSARMAFHAFSVAATAALDPLWRGGKTPQFEIYECAMVDEAIPGAPKNGRWIQRGGRNLANPFFGAEMLECGSQITR